MAKQRLSPRAPEVIEPPRDGEFFFEDDPVEVRLAGALERGLKALISVLDVLGKGVGRHPVLAMSLAITLGSLVTSLVMHF